MILGGDSAGGLATFLWADYVQSRVAGSFLALPDSGIFNDETNVNGEFSYRQTIISLTTLVN